MAIKFTRVGLQYLKTGRSIDLPVMVCNNTDTIGRADLVML